MKKFIVILLIMSFVGCLVAENNNDIGEKIVYKITESGLKYVITEQGNGVLAKTGDFVSVHYTGTLLDGTKFDSSYDRNEPISFKLGSGMVIKGWDEGIAFMHVGDKGRFEIPSDLAYGETANGLIPANSTLVFEVELVSTKPAPVILEFDVDGKVAATTDSGLQFILVKEGSGKKAAPGYTVTVHYTGYFEDGSIFDSSVERDQPFQFDLGMGRVIVGWDEGVALMKVGDKARLIIPFQLAYGEEGFPGVIPPKSTLIFDVELLDVK